MKKRGLGSQTGRERSRDRGDALGRLVECLDGFDFPMTYHALMAEAGNLSCYEMADGSAWSVRDLLTGVPVSEFTSPQHVAEVVRLRMEDMSDLFRPGRGGLRAVGPADEPVVEDHEGERAMDAAGLKPGHDRKAGP